MHAVLDLHGKAQLVQHVFLVLVHADKGDVGGGLADFGGDAGQDALFVIDQELDAAVEAAIQFAAPLDGDPAVRLLGLLALGVAAVAAVTTEDNDVSERSNGVAH